MVLRTSTLAARCSAVVVAPKTLLTADHCIDEGDRPPVAYLPAGAKSGQIGRVVRRDPARDLAWVQMPTALPHVAIGAVGIDHPVKLERPLWGGALLGRVLRQDGTSYRLSVPAMHGDSGSPVFNEVGELVALLITCERDFAAADPLACKVNGQSNAAVLTPEDSEVSP